MKRKIEEAEGKRPLFDESKGSSELLTEKQTTDQNREAWRIALTETRVNSKNDLNTPEDQFSSKSRFSERNGKRAAKLFGAGSYQHVVDNTSEPPFESNKDVVIYTAAPVSSSHMNEFSEAISIYDATSITEITSVLTKMNRAVVHGFPGVSDEGLGKILVTALTHALDQLERDIIDRLRPSVTLPEEAPSKYVPRQSGKASEFLVANYGAYIKAGVCFRPDIKRLDPKLETALTNEFRGRTDELRAILPNQTDAADARLASEFGRPIRPEERQTAMVASSARKHLKV